MQVANAFRPSAIFVDVQNSVPWIMRSSIAVNFRTHKLARDRQRGKYTSYQSGLVKCEKDN